MMKTTSNVLFYLMFVSILVVVAEETNNNNDQSPTSINNKFQLKQTNVTTEKSDEQPLTAKLSNNLVNLIRIREKETISLKCPIENLFKENNRIGLVTEEITSDYDETDGPQSDNFDDSYDQTDSTLAGSDGQILSVQRKKRDDSQSRQFVIVQWYKDSSRLNKLTTSNRFKLENNFLRIRNVNLNDAGLYKCKIINGFGSFSFSLTLMVEAINVNSTRLNGKKSKPVVESSNPLVVATNVVSAGSVAANGGTPPMFLNPDKTLQSRKYRKQKGTQIKFKCRANGNPRPDILWYKNGEVLNEEDYGITRSKWILDLKDLRMTDNGNFSCQVFNKYGYINATFELIVYEDSQIFEGLDPLNATILAGMNAVFNCKVKSNVPPNIKWMKQISKAEYANYVLQNNNNNLQSSSGEDVRNSLSSDVGVSDIENNELIKDNDALKAFYLVSSSSTRSSNSGASGSGANDGTSTQPINIQSEYETSLYDLINSNLNDNFKSDDLRLLISKRVDQTLDSNNNNNKAKTTDNFNTNSNDESVHYITLTSSPSIDQKMTFNPLDNYYISQLTIKQVNVKDTGIYVCFGGNTNGYSYRKSYLKVVPNRITAQQQQQQPTLISSGSSAGSSNSNLNPFSNFNTLNQVKASYFNNQQKPSYDTSLIKTEETSTNNQSIGLLIVLIPVILISSFAIASICYLKRINTQRNNNSKANSKQSNESTLSLLGLIKYCIFDCGSKNRPASSSNADDSSKAYWCCCPTGTSRSSQHKLIRDNSSSFKVNEMNTNRKTNNKLKMIRKSSSNKNENDLAMKSASNSLGSSSISDSSSTTATTVAYYATIPLLIDSNNSNNKLNNSTLPPTLSLPLPPPPPPPLPVTQPPQFQLSMINTSSPLNDNTSTLANKKLDSEMDNKQLKRTDSTPSMAYYKIVDNDLFASSSTTAAMPASLVGTTGLNFKQTSNRKQLESELRLNDEFKLDDAATCVSTNSRVYYQLTPMSQNQIAYDNNNIKSHR